MGVEAIPGVSLAAKQLIGVAVSIPGLLQGGGVHAQYPGVAQQQGRIADVLLMNEVSPVHTGIPGSFPAQLLCHQRGLPGQPGAGTGDDPGREVHILQPQLLTGQLQHLVMLPAHRIVPGIHLFLLWRRQLQGIISDLHGVRRQLQLTGSLIQGLPGHNAVRTHKIGDKIDMKHDVDASCSASGESGVRFPG